MVVETHKERDKKKKKKIGPLQSSVITLKVTVGGCAGWVRRVGVMGGEASPGSSPVKSIKHRCLKA